MGLGQAVMMNAAAPTMTMATSIACMATLVQLHANVAVAAFVAVATS